MSKPQHYVPQIFTPLALVLIFLTLFGWYEFYNIQKDKINDSVKFSLSQIEKLFQEELKDRGAVLRALLNFIKKDEKLQAAFINKDRDLLLKLATPDFNVIKQKYGVTQWYFHTLEKKIFLRTHSPERSGEGIARWTIINAAKTLKVSEGIEFSHLGRFALRVVLPWFADDELIGYLELGQELDGITSGLTNLVGGELYLAVNKSILKKHHWEDGVRMMGKVGDWNQFENFVFEDSTNGSFPVKSNKDFITKIIHEEKNFFAISTNKKFWEGGTVELRDVSGTQVGSIFFVKDTSKEINSMRRLMVVSSIVSVTILLLLLYFFYAYIIKIEGKLIKAKLDAEKANVKLQELDKLKSMFIASMSHELRTPLNSIIGFSGIILNDAQEILGEKYTDFMQRINKAGVHLLALISDMIDISRVEAGRVDVSISSFLLSDVVIEAMGLVRTDGEKKGLTLNADIPLNLKMNTDRRRLLQCLTNYISNAVKYSETGGVTVTARAHNGRVRVEVVDTGIGIAPAQRPQVFVAFERLESHLKVKAGGTGLGLHLTRKIVIEVLNGSVGFDSKEGEGSRFWLEVPLIIDPDK
jgi:signal transduction histidine kinase